MKKSNLFDHNFNRLWPEQSKFPINEDTQGRIVQDLLLRDIEDSTEFTIITGFTSISNIIKTFGLKDFLKLQKVKIVIGFEPDDRISKRLPHYSLTTEIKNFWLKQNISILHCAPLLNVIEKVNQKIIEFKVINKLHAKIYVGDYSAMLGSSNFSISGLVKQREANIRVRRDSDTKELEQYASIKQIAENYFELAEDYTKDILELFRKLLKDADWQEALARGISEILESKWMNDYPVLYKAIMSNELWPTQKMGIARAMKIIQDQGNLLIADPTGSGKTKLATALAYTIFHWLWENGLKDRSNALIICPKQIVDDWNKEQKHFKLFNKIESMGTLSIGSDKNKKSLIKDIHSADILIIDEAHNYLTRGTERSKAIIPKGSTNVILTTATPINKKSDDLLRLVELLDIDNLSDEDLRIYLELRKNRIKKSDAEHINTLKGYINQFILRRTKKELNRMIDRQPEAYKNDNGNLCKYPKPVVETYTTNETDNDKRLANEITKLTLNLKGTHYLQSISIPEYIHDESDKVKFLTQRFNSAPALAAYEIKSALRSSKCALYEYIYGTDAANSHFQINSPKTKSGNMIEKLNRQKQTLPILRFSSDLIPQSHRWLCDKDLYMTVCKQEISIYEQIAKLCLELTDNRELEKAKLLIRTSDEYNKVIGFDSTIITLDYLEKLINEITPDTTVIVATGQSEKNKRRVRELLNNVNSQDTSKLIALCSDAMSESINLPAAKVLVLLDMPSVLRIIEQRIGRLERMNSDHKEIYIYWPEDAEEFSLRGDRRIIEILSMTENLIGGNVEIPQKGIYEKYLKEGLKNSTNFREAFSNYAENNEEWEGVKDSYQSLYSLIEGKDALISEKIYSEFKDVDSTVKTAISFIEADKPWSFFAFRGDSKRSPKWLLLDKDGQGITDFSLICEKLRVYLKNKDIIQYRWNDINTFHEIRKIVYRLRKQEKSLLPWKKRRALETGKRILEDMYKHTKQVTKKELIQKILQIFDETFDGENMIDFNHFADLWLTILLPALDEKKSKQIRKRTIITLKDLKLNDILLNDEKLNWLYENCQYSNTLDELIASCIIAVNSSSR